ncbi:MAG: hypothetical protein E6447_11865 [Bradyrhizobium sp.]|nr:hypothetical protein [Bradyrhizobium sp.]
MDKEIAPAAAMVAAALKVIILISPEVLGLAQTERQKPGFSSQGGPIVAPHVSMNAATFEFLYRQT